MAWLTVLQFLLVASILVWLTWNRLSIEALQPVVGPLARSPRVSVCVPARNEERDVAACLKSLLGQNYPDFEIIVVDDNSTDRTWEIIQRLAGEHPELQALRGDPLPETWYGKPFALHQAVQRSRGEILLFTDADVKFQPHALTSAVYALETRKLDLLSLMPAAEFGSFWERAVQPVIFGFIAARIPFHKINSPDFPGEAMGFGAFIMIRRETYQRLGGHESLRQAILDDVGLARQAKALGARCWVANAKPLLSIRMYHSLGEIWRGWRKNMFLAFEKSVTATCLNAALLIGFFFTPYLLTLYHYLVASPLWLQLVSSAGLVMVWMVGSGLCHDLRLPWRTQFLFPLGAWVAAAVMVNSMLFILGSGKSEWRGRTYARPA